MVRGSILGLSLVAFLWLFLSPARADLLVSGDAGIVRYDETTGQYLGTVIPGPVGPFAIGPDQNLYKFRATGGGEFNVSRYDAATGAFLGDFTPTRPNPHPGYTEDAFPQLAFSPDGNFLYLLAYSNVFTDTHVFQYDGTTGAYIKQLFSLTFNASTRLGVGPAGNVYVSDTINGAEPLGVGGRDPITGDFAVGFQTWVLPDGPFIAEPGPFAFDAAGDFYVSAAYGEKTIYKFDGTTHELVGAFATSPSGIFLQYVFGPDGDLYATLATQNGVFRFDGTTGAYLGQLTVGAPEGYIYDMAFAPIAAAVPEPSTLLLLGAGLASLWRCGRSRHGRVPRRANPERAA
jgi:WD40 repeat protein